MPQFFVESSNISGNKCIIEGEDFHHLIKVRRAVPGDLIHLRLENRKLLLARILEISRSAMIAEIIDEAQAQTGNMPISLTICVSLLKGKRFDLVIQKATETGASRIIPVITERTVPLVTGKETNRSNRWRRIALEAAKQSMRKEIPVIEEIAYFKDVVSDMRSSLKLLAHPSKKSRNLREFLSQVKKEPDISILVGPEGGFSENEVERLKI